MQTGTVQTKNVDNFSRDNLLSCESDDEEEQKIPED